MKQQLSKYENSQERAELAEQLRLVTQSQAYLGLIILSVLLSYYVLGIQKKQIECMILPQKTQECAYLPATQKISLIAGILVIIALSFFFCTSVRNKSSDFTSPTAVRQEERSILASFLVLAAALLRFQNLTETA